MKDFIPQSARRKVIANPVVPPLQGKPSTPTMAIVDLPAALSGENGTVAALICRQTVMDTVATVHLQRGYAFNGQPPESYRMMGTVKHFALTGTVYVPFGDTADAVKIENAVPIPGEFKLCSGFQIQLTGIDRIIPELSDFDAIADTMLLFCNDEIMSLAEAKMTGKGIYGETVYTVSVLRGRFGTPIQSHCIGNPVWIAARAGIKPLKHPFFASGNTATFKASVGKRPLENSLPFQHRLK